MKQKCILQFAVTGHITQIVELRANVTTRQLRDGLERGVYKTSMNTNEIIDTISKQWMAKIVSHGPDEDFVWKLEKFQTREEIIAERNNRNPQ